MTTTVRRCSFNTFVVKTKQGRVFLISAPSVGSSRTHHTSPRLGTGPGFGGLFANRVELFFNRLNLRIVIGRLARFGQPPVALGELLAKGFGQILRAFPRRYFPDKLRRQLLGEGKRHLSGRHSTILPYIRASRATETGAIPE